MQPPSAKATRPATSRAATQALRREQLVAAAVEEIGATGSLDVTVAKIAGRAGVSPALAFHYFGDKEQLFLAAMRHIMSALGADVRARLAGADSPAARLGAVIDASFGKRNFQPLVVTAWLNFYVLANRSPEARRLLTVYHRRLHSNLAHDLRKLVGAEADGIAQRLAGLIVGLYLRYAELSDGGATSGAAHHVRAALAHELAAAKGRANDTSGERV